mmetsp:Transcript_29147/g.48976  ORF Transcript_29147/g.48976 Transcript_29147/m.48976 type:complete len:214 (+) Transcript_29147:1110-1751(+)
MPFQLLGKPLLMEDEDFDHLADIERAHLQQARDGGEGESGVFVGGLHDLAGAGEESSMGDIVQEEAGEVGVAAALLFGEQEGLQNRIVQSDRLILLLHDLRRSLRPGRNLIALFRVCRTILRTLPEHFTRQSRDPLVQALSDVVRLRLENPSQILARLERVARGHPSQPHRRAQRGRYRRALDRYHRGHVCGRERDEGGRRAEGGVPMERAAR